MYCRETGQKIPWYDETIILRVENIRAIIAAVIRRVEIERFALLAGVMAEFPPGMTVVTGETGAGKTLLLDAVDFAFGARASSNIFPAAGGRCRVAVEFKMSREEQGWHKIDRIARPGGAGRILLDGVRISAQEARALAAKLFDYSGQTENRSLLSAATHVRLLDSFGDATHSKFKEEFAGARARHGALLRRLELIDRGEAARLARIELLNREVGELAKANVRPGEHNELLSEKRRLANASRISERAGTIIALISGGDAGSGVGAGIGTAIKLGGALPARDALAKCEEAARALAAHFGEDTEVGEQWLALADDISSMEAGLGEVERAAVEALGTANADPSELERVQARLAEIDNLALRYGCAVDGLAAELAARAAELEELSGGETSREKVAAELAEAHRKADEAAKALSKSRAKTAKILVKRVAGYLARLDFAATEFEVAGIGELAPDEEATDAGEIKEQRAFRESGYDDVEFLVSLNPDEPARPLARVASGGEMSRLMLAVTAALAEHSATQVLMFDEIEAGVGGLSAQAVADVMKDMASHRQVIAVSHLAQVAGKADNHIAVSKTVKKAAGGREASEIELIAVHGAERRAELARMLGTTDPAKAKKMVDEMLER